MEAALRSVLRSLETGGEGFLVQLWPMATIGNHEVVVPAELREVMVANQQVFQALPGLPPS